MAKSVQEKNAFHRDPPDNSGRAVEGLIPSDEQLRNLLGLGEGSAVAAVLQGSLLSPIRDLTSNHGKRIRGQLVALACRLVNDTAQPSVVTAKRCKYGAEVVELIHAGSLIVDDIEDGSRMRRGEPALHVRYGLPVALNAGNWLYFWPFHLIEELDLPSETALAIYQYYHRTLLRAHFGQAIDLGSRVDALAQQQVSEVCHRSLQLKTGALMGFAMVLGGAFGGAPAKALAILNEFGCELGVALQMFDDLGNVIGLREPSKQYEDLMLCRPSWAWACAATNSSPEDYQRFVTAVSKLPDEIEVKAWIDEHDLIGIARASARAHLDAVYDNLRNRFETENIRWSARPFEELRRLGEEIAIAYG